MAQEDRQEYETESFTDSTEEDEDYGILPYQFEPEIETDIHTDNSSIETEVGEDNFNLDRIFSTDW